MAAIVLVAAAGVFVLGAVAGIVAVVSYGIHREQKRLRGEQGIRAGPDAPDYFLAEQAPDVVSGAARRLNGLYVHHLPSRSLAAAVLAREDLRAGAGAAFGHGLSRDLHTVCDRPSPRSGPLSSWPPGQRRGEGRIAVQLATAFPLFIGVMRVAGTQVMPNANRAGEGRDEQPCGASRWLAPAVDRFFPWASTSFPGRDERGGPQPCFSASGRRLA